MKRRSRKLSQISVRLPSSLIEGLDDLAEQLETTRTDVIEHILDAFFSGDQELIDDVFGEPYEEEGEAKEEEESEEEEPEESEEEKAEEEGD